MLSTTMFEDVRTPKQNKLKYVHIFKK